MTKVRFCNDDLWPKVLLFSRFGIFCFAFSNSSSPNVIVVTLCNLRRLLRNVRRLTNIQNRPGDWLALLRGRSRVKRCCCRGVLLSCGCFYSLCFLARTTMVIATPATRRTAATAMMGITTLPVAASCCLGAACGFGSGLDGAFGAGEDNLGDAVDTGEGSERGFVESTTSSPCGDGEFAVAGECSGDVRAHGLGGGV